MYNWEPLPINVTILGRTLCVPSICQFMGEGLMGKGLMGKGLMGKGRIDNQADRPPGRSLLSRTERVGRSAIERLRGGPTDYHKGFLTKSREEYKMACKT